MILDKNEARTYVIQAEAGWDHLSSWEQKFVKDMRRRTQDGEQLSERQGEKLHELAVSWSGPKNWRRKRARVIHRRTRTKPKVGKIKA